MVVAWSRCATLEVLVDGVGLLCCVVSFGLARLAIVMFGWGKGRNRRGAMRRDVRRQRDGHYARHSVNRFPKSSSMLQICQSTQFRTVTQHQIRIAIASPCIPPSISHP
jgi:hypothetical protein